MKKIIRIICLFILIAFASFLFLQKVHAVTINEKIPEIYIKAVNPGYTEDGKSNVGEMIEIARKNPDALPISLAGATVGYTNSSGNSVVLYEFPENSWMSGESILLRLASSPESELANISYSKTIAFKASISLMRNEEIIDSLCWTSKDGCYKEFKSANPTSLVRNLETNEFEHLINYEPIYHEANYYVEEKEEYGYGKTSQCKGLVFTEVLSYYETLKSEQFIELHNTNSEQLLMNGCKIKYKNKTYDLNGIIKPDGYFAYYPIDFSLTKNPNNSNTIEIIDANGDVIDKMSYPNGQRKATSYALIGYDGDGKEIWKTTYAPTPGEPNNYQEYKTCESGKVINKETGNCVKVTSVSERICIIEGRFFGGSNLNTLDVPFMAALDFSHTYDRMRDFPEIKNQDLNFNLPTINARKLKTVIAAGGNDKKLYEDAGITCIKGFANFIDSHTVAVGDKKYTALNFILATGSELKVIEIAGTNIVKYHTPETAIRIKRLPKVLAVVGAGSTGCEIAEYYSELGVKTIIFESADRLLPREDAEVGEVMLDYFMQRMNITPLINAKVISLEQDEFSKRVIFMQDNTEKMVRVEEIILATGIQPIMDYGLENAGVKYKNSGIVVDKYFATSAKNIYAVGDCLGKESSTERAYQEGLTLANNLTSKAKTAVNYNGFTRVTRTMPEVATVGFNEEDLIKRDRKFKKALVRLNEVTASKIYNNEFGFVKLLADKNDHILGATIVAPNASSMIGELALAIRHNHTAIELASTPHIMNSYNYAIKLAAKALLKKR